MQARPWSDVLVAAVKLQYGVENEAVIRMAPSINSQGCQVEFPVRAAFHEVVLPLRADKPEAED